MTFALRLLAVGVWHLNGLWSPAPGHCPARITVFSSTREHRRAA